MKKNINIQNIWCKNTKENYDKLLEYGAKAHFDFKPEYEFLSTNSFCDMWCCKVYGKKEIRLLNNEFQFV